MLISLCKQRVLIVVFSCVVGVVCVFHFLGCQVQNLNFEKKIKNSEGNHEHERLPLRVRGVDPGELPLPVRRMRGRPDGGGDLRRLPGLLATRAGPAQPQQHRVCQDVPRLLCEEEYYHLQVNLV